MRAVIGVGVLVGAAVGTLYPLGVPLGRVLLVAAVVGGVASFVVATMTDLHKTWRRPWVIRARCLDGCVNEWIGATAPVTAQEHNRVTGHRTLTTWRRG